MQIRLLIFIACPLEERQDIQQANENSRIALMDEFFKITA
jgi:hypothetical protein